MPRYPVLQPDGQFAIWSTIVDDFTDFDCSRDEVIRSVEETTNYSDLPGFVTKLAAGELPLPWWGDWLDLVAETLWRYGADADGARLALERTPDPLMRRYIEAAAARAQAEIAADDLRADLAAAVQRAEAAEAERDQLLRHLTDADQSTMERIAKIDALEAALAAVPVGALLRHIAHAQARGYPGAFADMAAITAWADAQPEVQP